MKSIQAVEREIISTFEALELIDEKYALLFQLGEDLPPMDPSLKTDQNLVRGCQSTLWFHLTQTDGCFHLQADSDSLVIKGIAALLVRLVEGRTAEEVLSISMDFIDQLNIWKLASERNNGLIAMLDHLHTRARHAGEAPSHGLPNPNNEDTFRSV
ncbi:MAG: SufE family protein [Brevefilum sp.]